MRQHPAFVAEIAKAIEVGRQKTVNSPPGGIYVQAVLRILHILVDVSRTQNYEGVLKELDEVDIDSLIAQLQAQ